MKVGVGRADAGMSEPEGDDGGVQRVVERVPRGGHAVAEQKIRDRYARLWDHVGRAIRIADVAEVLDNSSARMPFRLCASFEHGRLIGSPGWPKRTPAALLNDGPLNDG